MSRRIESWGASKGRKSGRPNRLAVFGAVIALMVFALPAGATTTKSDFALTGQVVGATDPGNTWTSGPILHVRGYEPVAVLTIDAAGYPAAGTSYGVVNFNINQQTGEGNAWGTSFVDLGDGGFECTASGSINPSGIGPIGEFRTVCNGFGAYEGTQLRGSIFEVVLAGSQTFAGYSFVPGDG